MKRKTEYMLCFLTLFLFWGSSDALLSAKDVNFEVQALMDIKASLEDPDGVLVDWDGDDVDPCSWPMIACSPDYLVVSIGTVSQNLSGTLSPSIGNLTNLQIVLLQNNNITGSIPVEIGKLVKLNTLDLSDNHFNGEIPSSLGQLKSLQYMRFKNNSLHGKIPVTLANLTQLAYVDLSYNNLTGPVPKFPTKTTINITGNPLICSPGSEPECNGTTLTR